MYVAIRRYQSWRTPGSVDDVLGRVNEGSIPIIRDTPGFLAYYALDSGGGAVTSVSVFEDQSAAEESNTKAADWVDKT